LLRAGVSPKMKGENHERSILGGAGEQLKVKWRMGSARIGKRMKGKNPVWSRVDVGMDRYNALTWVPSWFQSSYHAAITKGTTLDRSKQMVENSMCLKTFLLSGE